MAPVNSSAHAVAPATLTPSVINMVNPALKTNEGEPVYTSVSDPGKRGSEAATAKKDWTIHRPAPEKVEDPLPKPLSQVLMEHIKTLWTASASAIQLEQVKDQLKPPQAPVASEMPGLLAKEALTYAPNKIRKTENI